MNKDIFKTQSFFIKRLCCLLRVGSISIVAILFAQLYHGCTYYPGFYESDELNIHIRAEEDGTKVRVHFGSDTLHEENFFEFKFIRDCIPIELYIVSENEWVLVNEGLVSKVQNPIRKPQLVSYVTTAKGKLIREGPNPPPTNLPYLRAQKDSPDAPFFYKDYLYHVTFSNTDFIIWSKEGEMLFSTTQWEYNLKNSKTVGHDAKSRSK